MIKAVLFDLDGTLIDTAPDMAAVLNELLHAHNKPSKAFNTIRPYVSEGVAGLLKCGFDITQEHDAFETLRQDYLQRYEQQLCIHTTPFEGALQVIEQLSQRSIHWGIVTNKPTYLTESLLQALDLLPSPECLICGDTLPKRKPDPEPLLEAAKRLKLNAEHCIYVGDVANDIVAGQRANMKTIAARYGYHHDYSECESWNADLIIDSLEDIIQWLK